MSLAGVKRCADHRITHSIHHSISQWINHCTSTNRVETISIKRSPKDTIHLINRSTTTVLTIALRSSSIVSSRKEVCWKTNLSTVEAVVPKPADFVTWDRAPAKTRLCYPLGWSENRHCSRLNCSWLLAHVAARCSQRKAWNTSHQWHVQMTTLPWITWIKQQSSASMTMNHHWPLLTTSHPEHPINHHWQW